MAPARILVSGPASWNTLVHLDALPEPRPHTVFARRSLDTLGGTSAGKALNLVDLGCDVVLHTLVGDDEVADRITGVLAAAGVETVVDRVPGGSERHLNLMTDRGERVSIYLAVPGGRPPSPRAVDLVRGADIAVVDLAEHSRQLLDTARAAGAEIWTDIHDYDGAADFHRPFIDAATVVFMNADALGDPLPFLRSLVGRGARLAVSTLGERGAVAVDSDLVEHRVAAAPVERIVDTNGAGDAFLAGYLAAHLRGDGVDGALAAGARQAAAALGSRHLTPRLDAVLGG